MTRLAAVEAGNRIELPAELGLTRYAALERTEAGILVHSCPISGWDEVFAQKLPLGPAGGGSDNLQLTRDDLLL
jgi:hypothetical protein